MIRSQSLDLGEFQLIREPDHVSRVWNAIEESLPSYWDAFVRLERDRKPAAKLAAKWNKEPSGSEDDASVLRKTFSQAIAEYDALAEKYRTFFSPEAMDEYYDDPNAFKQTLSRDVPVIANTLRAQHAELKEWQMAFRRCAPEELRQVFANVLDFADDWCASHTSKEYASFDSFEDFAFDDLDNDETMFVPNVVGMGIKSIVLYHRNPEQMPSRGQIALYALFFLSGRGAFGLPTGSSEFTMINDESPASDGSLVIDQNYWYPYGLFSLYALRIYRWLERRAAELGVEFDCAYRFVYVDRFFASVRDRHADDLKTMRAHERFEVRL